MGLPACCLPAGRQGKAGFVGLRPTRNDGIRQGTFGFTLVEVLIAVAIFTIILALVLAGLVGVFNSLRKAQTVITREQRQRFFTLRLSREVASFTRITFPQMRFEGEGNAFFIVYAAEDSLRESRYVCDEGAGIIEHYLQEPSDYLAATFQTREVMLTELASCDFQYSDGSQWQKSWPKERSAFPAAIKANFRFRSDDRNRELIVTIPVSRS